MIYASGKTSLRQNLWNILLPSIPKSPPVGIRCDFKYTLSISEPKGGKDRKFTKKEGDFIDFMISNDLHDMPPTYQGFSWYNNRNGKSYRWARLDQVFINSKALDIFPRSFVTHLARITSDHCSIRKWLSLHEIDDCSMHVWGCTHCEMLDHVLFCCKGASSSPYFISNMF